MTPSQSINGQADECEHCGFPIGNHHVGDVCVERGDVGKSCLPWALRTVSLAASGQQGIGSAKA
jgi:hypothetical protein